MLVDSNNDGVVDGSDEADEEFQPMIFTYNVDDDDFSGTADIFEAPVVGEDDLAEVRLMALEECDPADPKAATWALNWTSDLITVWQSSDKSDDPLDLIENGIERPWPPPSSVWLEASDVVEDFTMTFWIFPFVGSSSDPDTVNIKVECPAPSLSAGAGECYANIRTDSNNDLKIDECDEVVETVSPGLIVYVNDDDDNENGTLDFDESPVVGENDLAELELSTSCVPNDPNLGWWSISWPSSTPEVLQVWLQPDKSDGAGGASTPLVSGTQYAWPPPASVWLEALDEFSDADVMFTVYHGNPSTSHRAQDPPRTDTVRTSGKPAKTVKLRVVMVVEPGADPDNPPASTYGCKLTRTQVEDTVKKLVGFEKSITPGLRFVWDAGAEVNILESKCMAVGNPLCFFSTLGTLNMRELTANWYLFELIDRGTDSEAMLVAPGDVDELGCPNPQLSCNGYSSDSCTMNIYFIGHATSGVEGITASAFTAVGPGGSLKVIVVQDGAGTDPNQAATPEELITLPVLEHEAGCHWMTNMTIPHSEPIGGVNPSRALICPDICIGINALNLCEAVGWMPTTIGEARRNAAAQVIDSCGDPP